jgi:hypothetical protein
LPRDVLSGSRLSVAKKGEAMMVDLVRGLGPLAGLGEDNGRSSIS